MRPRQLKSCVPVFVYGGIGGGGGAWNCALFLTISDMSCLCYANLPRAGNRAKLTAGQRLEWLYQSPQVGSLKPTQTYNLSRLTLLSSQNNHELQWLVLLPEQWWRGPSDGGSFRGYGLGSSKKACSQAHCLWWQELGSLLVLKLLGITRKCFQRLEETGFSEARMILNCSCPCPHLHGFVPGKLTSCMAKVQKE